MSASSHQTARLSRGKHRDPDDGTCVMELASLLAGEPFSDHPRSVCPVVAGFLRSYNDGIRDDDREDLYRFAAEAVGSRGDADVTAARAQLCHAWLVQCRSEHGRSGRLFGGLTGWPLVTAQMLPPGDQLDAVAAVGPEASAG